MAASTPPATSVGSKNTIRQKMSKACFKQVLRAPFQVTWPPLSPDENAHLLSRLKEVLAAHPVGNVAKRGGKRNGERRRVAAISGSGSAGEAEAVPTTHSDEKLSDSVRLVLSPHASEVVLGVNAVTRALEQPAAVRLVVVCRSTQPPGLTRHLATMAIQQDCPSVALTGLADALRPLMHLKSLAALAFKKVDGPSIFDDLVTYIASRSPHLSRVPQVSSLGCNTPADDAASNTDSSMVATILVPGSALVIDSGGAAVGDSDTSCQVATDCNTAGNAVNKNGSCTADCTLPSNEMHGSGHLGNVNTSDYTNFYIYKAAAAVNRKLPLSSPSESRIFNEHLVSMTIASDESANRPVSKQARQHPTAASVKYISAKVSKMQGNPDRKHKSKKLKTK